MILHDDRCYKAPTVFGETTELSEDDVRSIQQTGDPPQEVGPSR